MPRRRVYVVHTGGTIGMRRTPTGYSVDSGHLENVLAAMPEFRAPELPEWHFAEMSPLLDSACMTPSHWVSIARDIAAHYADYDGFVVLHGTDTMAYSASALSFMLMGLEKPVVLTGSQIPLCEIRNDARRNLITALLVAGYEDVPEVCLYFNGRLLRGNRSLKVSADRFEAFESPNYPDLGRAGVRIEIRRDLLLPSGRGPLRFEELGSARVGALRLFPGISADFVANALKAPLQGLVLECYGSGNGPIHDRAFLEALTEATARGCVIVDVTQCLRGTVDLGGYEAGTALARVGVISGFDLTAEAALAKLYYLLERERDVARVKEAMQASLCGEMYSRNDPRHSE
jgi:L-asparaginase